RTPRRRRTRPRTGDTSHWERDKVANSKSTKRGRRKLALVWGGATVSALALTSGAVAFAVNNEAAPNKDEHCAAPLEGAEGERVSNVAVSSSGEYLAGGGNEK